MKEYALAKCYRCGRYCGIYRGPNGPEILCVRCGRCTKILESKFVWTPENKAITALGLIGSPFKGTICREVPA